MSSLWDKLTGKAPFREDGETVEHDDAKKPEKDKRGSNRAVNMKERKRDFTPFISILKWLIPVGICLLLLIGSSFADSILNDASRLRIAEQVSQHKGYANIKDTKNADIKARQAQIALDEGRIVHASDTNDADNAVAGEFFRKYLTWGSSEEYNKLRDEALGLFENEAGNIMSCLFPVQWQYYDPDTLDLVYYIDKEGLNLKFDSLESYRTGTATDTGGVTYSAIVSATRNVMSQYGTVSNKLMFYAEYEVAQGNLTLTAIYSITDRSDF